MADRNKWTVMVYLAGDNNLSEEMIYAIKEMYRIGTNDQFKVIVQFDPSAIGPETRHYVISRQDIDRFKSDNAEILLKKDRAFAAAANAAASTRSPEPYFKRRPEDSGFNADGFLDKLAKKEPFEQTRKHAGGYPLTSQARLNKRVSETNSASPQALKDFIQGTISNPEHKADHYMLILSGHGSGAEGDFLPDKNPGTPDRLPSSLSIPSLGRVLNEVGTKIDILGMDACLMSMAEVAYEVSDSVRYLVASEGFELNTGWPYHRILETLTDALVSDKQVDAGELAMTIVEKYISYYQDFELAGASTDLSACDLEKLRNLPEALDRLAKELLAELKNPAVSQAVVLAHWEAQSYKNDQYVDLWDFCNHLEAHCKELQAGAGVLGAGSIVTECVRIQNAIERDPKIVLKSCYSGAAFQHSHGISVYFPWAKSDFFPINPGENYDYLPKYENLKFAKDTEGKPTYWVKFLREYLKITRRERRDEAKHAENGDEVKHFDAPNETVLFVRHISSNSARTTDSEAGSMKNPPDGFYRDECSKR